MLDLVEINKYLNRGLTFEEILWAFKDEVPLLADLKCKWNTLYLNTAFDDVCDYLNLQRDTNYAGHQIAYREVEWFQHKILSQTGSTTVLYDDTYLLAVRYAHLCRNDEQYTFLRYSDHPKLEEVLDFRGATLYRLTSYETLLRDKLLGRIIDYVADINKERLYLPITTQRLDDLLLYTPRLPLFERIKTGISLRESYIPYAICTLEKLVREQGSDAKVDRYLQYLNGVLLDNGLTLAMSS